MHTQKWKWLKKTPCKFYAQGKCEKGYLCTWSHNLGAGPTTKETKVQTDDDDDEDVEDQAKIELAKEKGLTSSLINLSGRPEMKSYPLSVLLQGLMVNNGLANKTKYQLIENQKKMAHVFDESNVYRSIDGSQWAKKRSKGQSWWVKWANEQEHSQQ